MFIKSANEHTIDAVTEPVCRHEKQHKILEYLCRLAGFTSLAIQALETNGKHCLNFKVHLKLAPLFFTF